jgi:hypothetical protein
MKENQPSATAQRADYGTWWEYALFIHSFVS